MTTYFEAYAERMKRNERLLLDFAGKLKENGFSIYKYGGEDRILKGYVIRKNGKHVTLNFSEVPYRWELGIMWKPNPKTGSGRTVFISYIIDEIAFTVSDIEEHMCEDYPGQWKNSLLTEL